MSFESKLSYTGTWGEERLNESKSKDNFKSTYSLTFNPESLQTIKDSEDNEFAKFKTLKATGMASLAKNYSSKALDDTRSESITTLTKTMSSSANLDKTIYARNRSKDAPIAVGRSGARVEKGTKASGLLGERLQLAPEPRINSLVQRSWMYCEDPALKYKINGLPIAKMPNDVSLAVGYDPNAPITDNRSNETVKADWKWDHFRSSSITAGPTSRYCGGGKRVFMDE